MAQKQSTLNTLDSRRKLVAEWMIALPVGEGEPAIEKAIKNAKELGQTNKQIAEFVVMAFATEIGDYLTWMDETKTNTFILE